MAFLVAVRMGGKVAARRAFGDVNFPTLIYAVALTGCYCRLEAYFPWQQKQKTVTPAAKLIARALFLKVRDSGFKDFGDSGFGQKADPRPCCSPTPPTWAKMINRFAALSFAFNRARADARFARGL